MDKWMERIPFYEFKDKNGLKLNMHGMKGIELMKGYEKRKGFKEWKGKTRRMTGRD